MPVAPVSSTIPDVALAETGIPGLDRVLNGGLTSSRLYLVEGVPGSGKTTLALQFLLEGARRGEPVLYVTLSETAEELHAMAASHGWSLDGIQIRELVPSEDTLEPDEQYTMFHPAEVELGQTTQTILDDVERLKPMRLVFDSLSEVRLLAGNPLRYRRQILALKQFFGGRNCTVLLLDDLTMSDPDLQLQSIANGVLLLEQLSPEYGGERRRLRVLKHRGRRYRGGYHDYIIVRGGLRVFPRLVAADDRGEPERGRVASDVPALDALLGGGIERGTSTLLVGGPGTGKSSLASRFVLAAAERGDKSAMFIFDESRYTLMARVRGLGMALDEHVAAGRVHVQQVDPAELSPGEFAHAICDAVEKEHARIVVLDSLNGFLQAMPNERFLTIQLHEMLTYLGQRGVATIMISAQQGLIGGTMVSVVDASYLADAVVLLRYFELQGQVRQAISVLKNRTGDHERTIREFRLTARGIEIGEPLHRFRGVLTGVPVLDEAAAKSEPPADS